MTVHLVNPSHLSFGVGVITPRWLFVLAGATPTSYGPPRIVDETLEPFDIDSVQSGDVVGIGIHTGNALRGYEIGALARDRGAIVIFGGIHATLYPGEAQSLGRAHAVVKGDGDVVWPLVLNDATNGILMPIYEAGRVDADRLVAACTCSAHSSSDSRATARPTFQATVDVANRAGLAFRAIRDVDSVSGHR
jgi:hypothetical protein